MDLSSEDKPVNHEQLKRIVDSLPNFSLCWTAFLSEWEKKGEPPWYLGMAELAHYAVEAFSEGRKSELVNLFSTIEDVLQNVDPDVEDLIAVGLFEDLQNIASHREFGPAPFRELLGLQSRQIWDKVDEGMKKVARSAAARPGNRAFDSEKALSEVKSAELRKIIESLYRK